jgi:hypothetical protein
MNTIRVNFLAERLIPNKQDGPMDPEYFKDLKEVRSPQVIDVDWRLI